MLAKHRSDTPEAPAYPVKDRCSQVQDWQTVQWTTSHPQKAYLLQYVYGYLTQGHEGNNHYVRMKPAATKIIRQGVGLYATQRLQPATTTPWATREGGARIDALGWAMGIVRGANGGKMENFLHRSGAMTKGATERLMAAYLTWRDIPLPRSLEPLARRAQQPHVPPPRPGTYGNAAVARMMAGGARHQSSSSSSRKTATITTLPPRSRATAATRATNVRALAPWGVGAPQGQTASTSSSPSSSAPDAPVTTPHRQHAADATRTTDAPAPSMAGAPQSPRQECASERAAQRLQPQHHAATGIQGHRASPAGSGAVPSPTNTGAVGTRL